MKTYHTYEAIKINLLTSMFFLSIFFSSCFSEKVIAKVSPTNPTSYTFKTRVESLGSVLEKYIRRCNSMKLNIHDMFYLGSSRNINQWPNVVKNALSGEANMHDIWMQITVDSSDIYFNKKDRPFEYLMECVAHFIAIDSNTTKVEIKVVNAKIHIRDQFFPSPPHFVNNPVYKKVKPTTIEEYKILQCFGKIFGVIDTMPRLQLPE